MRFGVFSWIDVAKSEEKKRKLLRNITPFAMLQYPEIRSVVVFII